MRHLSRPVFSSGIIFAALSFIISGEALKPQLEIYPVQKTQVKPVGKNVLLTCQVTTQQPELISDQKWLDQRGQPIDDNNRYTRDRFQVNVIGPQKLALVIYNLRENDEGNFTCIATYQSSEQLSKSVILKTYVPVTWKDAPEEQYPLLGDDYKVMCKVTARPAPRFDWQINGRQVPKDDRFMMETDGLLIRNVQVTDDGVYTCRALVIDTGLLQKREIKVEVHIPPKMTKEMEKVTEMEAVEGESATMLCQAEGKPPPTYTWIKASTGKNLGTFSDRFAVNEVTGQLSLIKVSREDFGDFKCIANNGAGSVKQNIRLTVIVKPQIAEFYNISIRTEKEVVMECKASGNPTPIITFWKLSSPKKMIAGLQPDDQRISVQQQERDRGQTVGILTITSLKRKDNGLYACIATNKGGEDIKSGHLTIGREASIPTEIINAEIDVITGNETNMFHNEKTPLSSSLLIGVVAALVVILIIIIIGVSCFFANDTGLLWLMCGKKKSWKPREDEAKLGSEGNKYSKIRIDTVPTEDGWRDTTVEYDLKKSVSRTRTCRQELSCLEAGDNQLKTMDE